MTWNKREAYRRIASDLGIEWTGGIMASFPRHMVSSVEREALIRRDLEARTQRPHRTARVRVVDGRSEGLVYLIQSGRSGPIKIGWATDVDSRLASLQTGCPERLRVVATVRASRRVEFDLHARFAEERVRGEWFRGPKVRAFLAGICRHRSADR